MVVEFLRRAAGFLLGLVLLVVALVFASMLIALFAVLAIAVGGWFWWRTRALRNRAAQQGSVVIEGEYRVEREDNRLDDRRT